MKGELEVEVTNGGRTQPASEPDLHLGRNSNTFLVDHLVDDFAADYKSMLCYTLSWLRFPVVGPQYFLSVIVHGELQAPKNDAFRNINNLMSFCVNVPSFRSGLQTGRRVCDSSTVCRLVASRYLLMHAAPRAEDAGAHTSRGSHYQMVEFQAPDCAPCRPIIRDGRAPVIMQALASTGERGNGRKLDCNPILSSLSLIMEIIFACNVLVSKFRLRCIYSESRLCHEASCPATFV